VDERDTARMARGELTECFDKAEALIVTDGSAKFDDMDVTSLSGFGNHFLYGSREVWH
jgi:hypothetical protein